ncbi:MAG: hypothetical protein ACXWUM_04140 [Burkholderiaceae bacterium]
MSQFDVTPRRGVRTPARSKIVRLASLVAGVFSVAVLVRGEWAERVDASETSAGKDAVSEFTVQVSADLRTLDFSGPIVLGVTERVRELLDAHPGITTVRLTSPGGRVVEARDLADTIRERGLTTIAAGNCASACTVIFMAGRDRLLGPAGNIGFHRYRSPDPAQEEAQANMAIDRRLFRTQGVPNWFLDQAFDTPNSGMWRPSLAEMKVANVITGELTAEGQRIGAPADRASIEAAAWQSPLYTALKNHEPEVYEKVIEAMVQGASNGVSMNDVSLRTRPLINQLTTKYVRAASDEAILKATAVAAETMRTLQARSVEGCYRYFRPSNEPADLSAIPFELRQRDVASTAAIIETGARGEARAAGSSMEADYELVRARLLEQFGEGADVLDRLEDPDVDRATACNVVTRLYEHALSLPAPRNAQLLRFLLAGN